MPVVYDKRRPRVTLALAERIDAVRGQVPFDRWVRMACVLALEQALGDILTPEGTDARAVISPAPARAPRAGTPVEMGAGLAGPPIGPQPASSEARGWMAPGEARVVVDQAIAPPEVQARAVMPKDPPEGFGVPEKKKQGATTAKEDLWARQQKLNQGKYGR